MIVRKDLLLRSLIVTDKAVTQEQFQECLKIQREQNFYKSIGTIMVEKGYLTIEKVCHFLKIQEDNLLHAAHFRKVTSGETLFGTIAVMKKYASLPQIEESLGEQRRLRRQGIFLRLGEILVSKKYMSVEQVLSVLKRQDTHVLCCSLCRKRFNVTTFSNRKRFFCSICGGKLVQPDEIEDISVNGKIEG